MKSKVIVNVLGLDPGKTNFGWSASRVCIDQKTNYVKINLLGYGKIQNTVFDLTADVKSQLKSFFTELNSLLANYEITMVVSERYQSRGIRGNVIEYVNTMLGAVLCAILRKEEENNISIDYTTLLASTWKNEAKRQKIDLKKLYKEFSFTMSPHELDASFISWYGAIRYKTNMLPLSGINSSVNTIVMSSETTKKKIGKAIIVA